MGQVDAAIAHPPHGELLIPSYMRTGYNETDFYGIGKTPTKALESGIPVYAPRAVRRIQVGQARRRLTVTVMVQAARPAYIYLIDERQAAWMKHRNGIKHIAQLQAGLRYWATQEGLEALSALFDLEEAFPSMLRWAVKRIKILKSTDDGFLIAEEDMNLRGYGDISGFQQSGMKYFKIADPVHHEDLFKIAEQNIKKIDQNTFDTKKYNFLLKLFDKAEIINDFEFSS